MASLVVNGLSQTCNRAAAVATIYIEYHAHDDGHVTDNWIF